jgi:hypothetical protein
MLDKLKLSRELYLLERFLPSLFTKQSYSVSQPSPPLPDALINVNGQIIGIETTALILNKQSRQRESAQDGILNQAQINFETQCQMPLHVTVSFVETADWEQVERKQIATFLTEVVAGCILEAKELAQSNSHFTILKDRLHHSHIRRVGVSYSHRLTLPCWSPSIGFVVPDAPADLIQDIISHKSQKIGGYLSGCEEVWLLMLETGSPSSYYDGYEKLAKLTFTSGFARTLIGRIPNGEVVVLQTQQTLNSPESHS